MLSFCRVSPVTGVTGCGTSCRLSDRRRAVTTISPSVASFAAGGAGGGGAFWAAAAEAIAVMLALARASGISLVISSLPRFGPVTAPAFFFLGKELFWVSHRGRRV